MTEKIKWYQEVLDLEPNSKVFFPLARLYAEENDYEQAIKVLEKGLARHDEYLEARLFLIELLHKLGRRESCEAQVAKLSKMFASYAGFWQAWATCLSSNQVEADTASILRFLAAHFVCGPIHLHDVLNRGVKSLLKDVSGPVSDDIHQSNGPNATVEMAKSVQENQESVPIIEESEKNISQEEESDKKVDPQNDSENASASDAEVQDYSDESLGTQTQLEHANTSANIDLKSANTAENTSENAEADSPANAIPVLPEETEDNPAAAATCEDISVEMIQPQAFDEPVAAGTQNMNSEEEVDTTQQQVESSTISEPEIATDQPEDAPAETATEAIPEIEVSMPEAEIDGEMTEHTPEAVPMPTADIENSLEDSPDTSVEMEVQETEATQIVEAAVSDISDEKADALVTEHFAEPENIDSSIEMADLDISMPAETIEAPETDSDDKEQLAKDQDDMSNNLLTASEGAETIQQENAPTEIEEAIPETAAQMKNSAQTDKPQDSSQIEQVEQAEDDELPEEHFSLRTRSMAEVLAEQGDIKGALDIYQELATTTTNKDEAEDIQQRINTLKAKVGSATNAQTENPDPAASKEKLIDMLEALAQRFEARVQSQP